MQEFTWTFYVVAALASVFAGISKGGFGSGAAFAPAAILALMVEPGVALGVMLPLLMLVDAATLRPYWGKWNLWASGLLILGGIPGVVIGALLFSWTNADVFRVLIGSIALGFVIWQVGQSRNWFEVTPRALPDWVGVCAGTIAGFTSFVSHAGGPPAAVYLLSLKPGKTEFQASTVLIFWVINVAKFIPYAFLGMFTLQTFQANLLLAPFALAGAWLGVKAHHMISDRVFFVVTYVALVVTGVRLIWVGLS